MRSLTGLTAQNLDTTKQHNDNLNQAGRPPSIFVLSAIGVGDGVLKIRCTPLEPPDGKFSIACGTI